MKVDANKYDESWDHKRRAAVRLMMVVLKEDDRALLERVGAEGMTKTYGDTTEWFRREAGVLRKTAAMLETAAGRVTTVLKRQRERMSEATTR